MQTLYCLPLQLIVLLTVMLIGVFLFLQGTSLLTLVLQIRLHGYLRKARSRIGRRQLKKVGRQKVGKNKYASSVQMKIIITRPPFEIIIIYRKKAT